VSSDLKAAGGTLALRGQNRHAPDACTVISGFVLFQANGRFFSETHGVTGNWRFCGAAGEVRGVRVTVIATKRIGRQRDLVLNVLYRCRFLSDTFIGDGLWICLRHACC
jgi:hypothetical protein